MAISIGIDPGALGAIVMLDSEEKTAKWGFIPYRHDKLINSRELFKAFNHFHGYDRITVEKLIGRGGDAKWGAQQNFGLGANYGKILQVLEMYPLYLASPCTWQRLAHYEVNGKTAKDKTLAAFDRLNPSYGGIKKSHNGLADAFFIARYGLDCLKCKYSDDWNFIKVTE